MDEWTNLTENSFKLTNVYMGAEKNLTNTRYWISEDSEAPETLDDKEYRMMNEDQAVTIGS